MTAPHGGGTADGGSGEGGSGEVAARSRGNRAKWKSARDRDRDPHHRREKRRDVERLASAAVKLVATAEAPKRKTAARKEELGETPILNGQARARWVVEGDPDGNPVTHAINVTQHPLDRMRKSLGEKLWEAGNSFRHLFQLARLESYATINLLTARTGGRGELSDSVVNARQKVNEALRALARSNTAVSVQCAWHVIGLGMSTPEFASLMRLNGHKMTADKAQGVLLSTLERLAIWDGTLRIADVKRDAGDERYVLGFQRGVTQGYERAASLADDMILKMKREKRTDNQAVIRALMELSETYRARNTVTPRHGGGTGKPKAPSPSPSPSPLAAE